MITGVGQLKLHIKRRNRTKNLRHGNSEKAISNGLPPLTGALSAGGAGSTGATGDRFFGFLAYNALFFGAEGTPEGAEYFHTGSKRLFGRIFEHGDSSKKF